MGSKTTQSTTIPPPSPEEKALMQMATDTLIPAYLEQQGFEVKKTTTTWDDSPEGQRFASQKAGLQKQLDDLLNSPQQAGANAQQKQTQVNYLQNQISAIDTKSDQARKDNPDQVSYQTRQKLTPELEGIRSQYGEDSAQYKQAYGDYQKQQVATSQQEDQIKQGILDKTQKFLSGDFSLNDNEKQFIDQTIGPLKEAVSNSVKYLQDEAANSDKSISSAIDNYSDQIKQTQMNMGDAVMALEDRVKQTGVNMKDALNEEVSMTKNLISMGLQDFTRDQRKSIAQQAATLGRSPSDPAFQKEMQDNVDRQIQETGYQLGQYAADKSIGIAQQTGQGLESAAQTRLGIAERTGAGLEGAAQAKTSLAERTAGLREEAARTQGQGEMGVAQQGASLTQNLALGLPSQQIGQGMNLEQLNQSILQQRLQNAASAINAPLGVYGQMAQERFAQPTNTTTKSGGVAGFLGGLLGTAASAAGAVVGMSPAQSRASGLLGAAASANEAPAAGWAAGYGGGAY